MKYSDKAIENVKRIIMNRAIREFWKADQIQYAEDYIDKLNRAELPERQYAVRPIGLEPTYSRIIRETLKRQYNDVDETRRT